MIDFWTGSIIYNIWFIIEQRNVKWNQNIQNEREFQVLLEYTVRLKKSSSITMIVWGILNYSQISHLSNRVCTYYAQITFLEMSIRKHINIQSDRGLNALSEYTIGLKKKGIS